MTDGKKKRKPSAHLEPSDSVFDRLEAETSAAADLHEERKAPSGKRKNRKSAVRRTVLTLAILACIAVLIVSGIAIAGFVIARKPYIFPNVYVGNINLGGLTTEQAVSTLTGSDWEKSSDASLSVELPADVSFELDYIASGAGRTKEQAVSLAYAHGRTDKLLSIPFNYLRSFIFPVNIDAQEKALNEDYIRKAIDDAALTLDKLTNSHSYRVDEKERLLVLTKGAGELELNREGLYNSIVSALLTGSNKLEYKELNEELKEPDLKKLYSQLAVEPADAYYTEYFEVVNEVVGCNFDIELAKKIWDATEIGAEVKIPLQYTQPEITGTQLREALFSTKLGSQSTSFKWSSDNRIGNINLVADKLNGQVLLPGETFSFNEFVGQRTEEAGFRTASAYNDGQVVDAIGGGICQVSSTLYCASMYAGLKTVSRTNHYFKVDYLDRGYDATVSWTKPDFKFQNSRDFPIRLSAYCDNEECTLTIEIWGTDYEGGYVTLRTVTTEIFDKEYTDTLIGYTVTCYRSYFDADDNFLYEKAEPSGAYYLHEEEIKWPKEKDEDYLAALREIENKQNMTEDEYLGALSDLYSGYVDPYAG